MNGCIVNILVITLCIGITGAASASRVIQPDPLPPDASPHEVLERLVRLDPGWSSSRSSGPLLARIRNEPEEFAPAVAEMLEVPERLEEWDARTFSHIRLFAHGVLYELGVERSEPILVKYFRDGYRLYTQADEELATIRHEAGRPPYEDEELQARFEFVQRQHHAAMSIMTRAVSQLMQFNSPALVDDMLKFWEAGYVDRRTNLPRYPLMFAHERPDVIPRLKALMENPEIDRAQRMRIKRALEQHAATLREAEAEEPPGIRADPQDSAPDERKDEAPKR